MAVIGTDTKKPPRIALAGAGGTGKGTIGRQLAAELKLPYLPSHIKDTGEAMGLLNSFWDEGSTGALAFQWAILIGQIYQERALILTGQGYVAERTTLDYLAYFIKKDLDRQAPKAWVLYRAAAVGWAAETYDTVFHCKPDFTPCDGDTWRERDPKSRQETDYFIRNYFQYLKCPVITLDGGPEQRIRMARVAAGLPPW